MLQGFYSVFDPSGKKIADCGAEKDALNLLQSRNKYWEGHYYQYNPLPGYIIDVTNDIKQLPTTDIVVNMDGGVGGSWEVQPDYEKLPDSNLEALDL